MSTATYKSLLPWEDRWAEPTINQLFEPLIPQHRKAVEGLCLKIQDLELVEKSLVWYGSGWYWTIQYDLNEPSGNLIEPPFCYVVPDNNSPRVCVPLTDKVFERLPVRRLNKFVRNATRSAKRGFDIYWFSVQLSASTEAEQLMDLIKRKYRYRTEAFEASKSKK